MLNEVIEIVIHRGRWCSVLRPCFTCMEQPGITNSRNMYTACLDIQLEVACSLFKSEAWQHFGFPESENERRKMKTDKIKKMVSNY